MPVDADLSPAEGTDELGVLAREHEAQVERLFSDKEFQAHYCRKALERARAYRENQGLISRRNYAEFFD